MRDLAKLPKAHLHLHLTGSMRHSTLLELAERDGLHLPASLAAQWPPVLSAADDKGWFRFQRLYDTARTVLRSESDVRRLLRETALSDAADGSVWTEIQVDPSGYGHLFGGITAFAELIIDATAIAAQEAGIGMSVVIAANRTKHPLDARTLARLAARYAGRGVHGFGLSNDERRGNVADFAPAFAIAERAGLIGVPHAGELCGPAQVRETLDHVRTRRLGHGIRSAEDPELVARLIDTGTALEVCPASNVGLGVYRSLKDVPVRPLFEAGVLIALGADDPLLFGSGLAEQYELLRHEQGFSDAELAMLARQSLQASSAPDAVTTAAVRGIESWLNDETSS